MKIECRATTDNLFGHKEEYVLVDDAGYPLVRLGHGRLEPMDVLSVMHNMGIEVGDRVVLLTGEDAK
jgi:hypothetical protein